MTREPFRKTYVAVNQFRPLLAALFVCGVLLFVATGARASEITPAGKKLADSLEAMNVEQHWLAGKHVNWLTGDDKPGKDGLTKGGSTHCSAFAAAAADKLGIYLLHPPEHSDLLLASAQQDWLEGAGRAQGWRPVKSPLEAQVLANRGELVVVTFKSPDPKKPGHIAVIRPSTKSEAEILAAGPQVTQAGKYNHNSTTARDGFKNHPGAFEKNQLRYFVHPKPATHGMVSSTYPLATEAGLEILQAGGNAIDAAVAVGLTLSVVDGHNSGIGGGCFMLIRRANGEFVAIDGREKAPAAATRDMFVREGKADTRLSQTGALASGVPGEIAAFDYAVKNFGKKKFGELFAPGTKIAEDGFALKPLYANRLKSTATDLAKFDDSRKIFFKNSEPLKAGDILKQPDLAKTYRALAKHGSEWFYRGPFAKATAKWMKSHGGIMTAKDFADYKIALREPVSTDYRGYKIVTFAPPSSGGVHLLEMLNTLENFDLKKMDEATRLHVIAETMKLAFADRAHWLGDPDFVKVPRGLVSKSYAATLAKKINLERVMDYPEFGTPPDAGSDFFADKHTTHFSVADAEGNWVACTCTVNTGFGSKVVVPGTGVLLNDQMDDFSVQAGVPNHFGLVGSDANAVAPGKRPLSSMTPTIVLKDGKPIIAIGAAGGPKIITTVLLELVEMLDLGQTPKEAAAAPRIHHQWSPDELMVEKTVADDVKKSLTTRGQKISEIKMGSTSHIVALDVDGKSFVGAADPRAGGTAEGW